MSETKEHTSSQKNKGIIDFIFDNWAFCLLLVIFIFGFSLRYLAAAHVEPNADEMVHGPHAVGIINSGVLGRVWQSILWSYMTDFFNSIGGISLVTSRALSLIYGSLTILLVYLIALEVFNRRVALLSAFLLAVSSFHIIYTLIEMDLAAVFFVLLAALLFIKRLKKDGELSLVAAFFIGIAALIKTLALFFVLAFIIGYCLYRKKIINKKIIMRSFYFGLIILLVFLPIILHNFLWYRHADMVDAYLAQYFDIGKSREVFSSIQGIDKGFKFSEVIQGTIQMAGDHLKIDPLNFILGISGLMFFLYKKKPFTSFFLSFQIIPFLLITVTNRLQTHYAVFPPVLAIYTAALLDISARKFPKISYSKIIIASILIISSVSAFISYPYVFTSSAVGEMRDYASSSIEPDSVVIADARIYRGRIMWMFIDKHYLEATHLPEILSINNNATGPKQNYKTYFIECVPDDCGWGTIKDQPEFNKSMEDIVELFKQSGQEVASFTGGGSPFIDSSEPYFKVYSAQMSLDPRIIPLIDSTHNFFYYPAYYMPKEKILDYYPADTFPDNVLFQIGKFILWMSFIVAFAAIAWLFYQVYKRQV